MRKSVFRATLLSLSMLSSVALASDQGTLYVPPVESISVVPIAGYTAYSVSQTEETVISDMYMHRTYGDNHYKGALGEYAMHAIVEEEGWTFTNPRMGKAGPQGLDGLYVKYDRLGNPNKLLVTDAKWGSSKLGMTLDKKQMSQKWIDVRLRDVSARYKNAAESISNGKFRQSPVRLPQDDSTSTIRLRNGNRIEISMGKNGNVLVVSV